MCFRRRKWARDTAKVLRAHLCKLLKGPADSLPACQFPQSTITSFLLELQKSLITPKLFLISLSNATVCLGQSADTSFLVSSEIIYATGLNTVNGKYLSLTFCLSITICCPMTWAFIVQLIHSAIVSPWLKDSKGLSEKKQSIIPTFQRENMVTDNKQVVKLRTLCQLLLLWFSIYYPTTTIPSFLISNSKWFKSQQRKHKNSTTDLFY